MTKSRKLFSALLAIMLFASLVISGCSKSGTEESAKAAEKNEASAGKVTLDFWTFWGSETRRPIIEKIIDDFNKSQDKIFVKHTYLPFGDIWTKNLAAVAAGNPPDVIINDINTVAQRAEANQSEDISEFLDDNEKDQFFPELWKTVEHEGGVYALPFNTDTRFLYYNKKHFEEAGLDPEKGPATWEELEQFAKKLDKKEGKRYSRIGFYPLWGDFGANNWMLNADGGQGFMDEEGNPTIDTKNKVEALEWINKWTDRLGQDTVNAYQAEFGNETANPFISGKVSMWLEKGTFYTQLRDYGKDVEFGVVPIPEKEEGSGHWSWGGGFVAEVPKGAKHKKEAVEFVKYLAGEEAQYYWAAKNFDNVANIKASEKAANGSELPELDKSVYKMAVDNLEVTKLTPVPLTAPDYINLVNPQVDAAKLGQVKPEKALKKAQKDVEKLIQSKK